MSEQQIIRNGESYDLDTREKLNEELMDSCLTFADHGGHLRAFSYVSGLLDRQAAITERETVKQWEDQAAQLVNDANSARAKVDELTAEREQYRDNMLAQSRRVAELTTERDELQAAIDAMGNGQFYAMYRKACDERDHFKDLVKESAERICVPHGEWERLSQTQEFRRMYCDCGYELGMDTHETFPYEHTIYSPMPYFCPECGARIESKANTVTNE